METIKNITTPLNIIANVSTVITRTVDRITGSRVDYPLLVCAGTVEALHRFGIKSQIMYGHAAWIEVTEQLQILWAGCWGEHVHLWVATEYGEIVDLNTSVAYRRKIHSNPALKAKYSPPILWSNETPSFYRYHSQGLAEIELTEERDIRWMNLLTEEIDKHCRPELLVTDDKAKFPNEPILCSGRRLLDDSKETFKHFDRALGVQGVPQAPF